METFYDLSHIEALLNQVKNRFLDAHPLAPLRSLVVDPITSIVSDPFNYFYQEHLLDEKLKNLNTEHIENLTNYAVNQISKIHATLHSYFDYSKEILDYARALREHFSFRIHFLSQHITYIEIFGILSILGIAITLIVFFLQNRKLQQEIIKIKQTMNKN